MAIQSRAFSLSLYSSSLSLLLRLSSSIRKVNLPVLNSLPSISERSALFESRSLTNSPCAIIDICPHCSGPMPRISVIASVTSLFLVQRHSSPMYSSDEADFLDTVPLRVVYVYEGSL